MTDAHPIVLLVPGFPASEKDSTCLPAIQSYVEALRARLRAPAIDVLAFQYPFEQHSYRWRDVRVHALGGSNKPAAKPRTWIRALRTGRSLTAAARGTIHSFWMGECALVGAYLAWRSGWTHVVSAGGQEVRRPTLYSRILQRSPFHLTAGSEYAAAHVRHTLGREVDAVVPLGLDIRRVAALAPSSGTAERPIDLLVVGSLVPVKRVEDAIEVAARLVPRYPDLTVEIIGAGPERDRLQARITDSGLGEHVVLRGEQPRETVLRLMHRSRILLHPSEYESQGYVFLEALACGMFVVCRRVGHQPHTRNVIYAETLDETTNAVEHRLTAAHDPDPVEVHTADASVDAFLSLYRSDTA